MDPKFQSSFIPKGPSTSLIQDARISPKVREKSLLSFLSILIFIIALLLAGGVFGYKFYLKYNIEQMGTELEIARANLQQETITEMTRLDNRINSVKELLASHYVLTPLFEFLEVSTPKTVRFNSFEYIPSESSFKISMNGEARGYASLALLSDILSKSDNFKNAIFSNLNLNERGDVSFSFTATINPDLISYQRYIERSSVPITTSTDTTSVVATSSSQITN